jgi:hypothetical protein
MSALSAMNHLAVIETQKVKSYLFASPVMREIRGASLLLDRINRKEIEALLKAPDYRSCSRTIYLGGGSGRVLFSDPKAAEDFCRKVEARCRELTVNGRVVGEVVSREAGEPFSRWLTRGLDASRRRKTGRSEALAQVAGRWIRPCSSCGVLPAERIYPEHGTHHLCGACFLKREEVNHLYRQVKPGERRRNELASADSLKSEYSEAFIFTTLGRQREVQQNGGTLLPQDFEDIGKRSRPKNYMAFIYADGNRMGETLRQIGELYTRDNEAVAAQGAFSEIVDRACREAAVEAVLKNVPQPPCTIDGRPGVELPAEFIMAGGDDLMLAVPSQCALEVAADFLDLYQEKTRSLQQEYVREEKLSQPFASCGLTSSAGVVLAHAHYPVRHLMEMAADLMKLAKHKAARQAGDQVCGTLDFMVVSDAASGKVKERRREEYRAGAGGACELTERPYTVWETRRMVELIRRLKRVDAPRNKLKKLYAALFQSPLQAQYDGLRIRERLSATGGLVPGSPLAAFIESLNCFPFRAAPEDPNRWRTPLSEIVEFYDYIQPA